MALINKTRLATLNEVLTIIDQICNERVKRDGSPPKHLKIRGAIRALALGESIRVSSKKAVSDE